jgi:hypothetical protein
MRLSGASLTTLSAAVWWSLTVAPAFSEVEHDAATMFQEICLKAGGNLELVAQLAEQHGLTRNGSSGFWRYKGQDFPYVQYQFSDGFKDCSLAGETEREREIVRLAESLGLGEADVTATLGEMGVSESFYFRAFGNAACFSEPADQPCVIIQILGDREPESQRMFRYRVKSEVQ